MTHDTVVGPESGLGGRTALLTVARLSTTGAFFGLSVIAARLLDPAALGSAAVGQTIAIIAALLANGGVNISTVYFIRQRGHERAVLVGVLVGLATVACAVAMLIVVVSAPVTLGLIIGHEAWPLLVSAAVLGASIIAFEFCGALLLGLGRPMAFIKVELFRGGVSLVAVTVLLLSTRADHGFVLGIALGYAMATVIGARSAWRDVPLWPRHNREFGRQALRFGLKGQIGNVLQFLGLRIDMLIVSALLNLQAAGIYFIAARVSDVAGQAGTAASSLVFPGVAGQVDQRSTQATERAVRITLLVVAASAAAIAVVAEPLMRLAFGPSYGAGTPALLVLLAASIPLSLARIITADLKGRGRPGSASSCALIAVVATIVLDVLLIPAWGTLGAAIASLIAYTLMAAALVSVFRIVTGASAAALIPSPADVRDLRSAIRGLRHGVARG